MAELVVIYGLHVAFHKIQREEKPSPIHYMAVVIEVLLLGYKRLAESSLKLLHCFSMGSEKRLFIDAGLFVGNGGSIYYLLMLLCLSYLSSLFFIVAPPSFTTPQFLQKNSSELAYYHCHFWCIGCSSRRLTEMLNPTKTERAAKTFWKCCMARFVNPAIMITEHSIGRAFWLVDGSYCFLAMHSSQTQCLNWFAWLPPAFWCFFIMFWKTHIMLRSPTRTKHVLSWS